MAQKDKEEKMVIKFALSEDELEALNRNRINIDLALSDLDDEEEFTEEASDREDYLLTLSDVLGRIVDVAINENEIRKEKNKKRIRNARHPLSEKEKEGLTDLEVFKREYGLYSASMYNQYWIDKFIEIYGYEPELP